MVSLKSITRQGKALFLAYDHGLEHGPDELAEFSGRALDPRFVLQIARQGRYNALVLQQGIAEKYYPPAQQKVPLIVKLNGKTELVGGEAVSRQVCSVKDAKRLGAKAVGYTLYAGSQHESIMFAEFGRIVSQAHRLKLPAIAWVYPRGKKIKDESSPGTIEYAARIGLEMGADIVKIKYCSARGAFERAVKAAGKTKVMLAGGPKTTSREFLRAVQRVMQAGAIGLVVGRNVWQAKEPLRLTREIKKIIFPK